MISILLIVSFKEVISVVVLLIKSNNVIIDVSNIFIFSTNLSDKATALVVAVVAVVLGASSVSLIRPPPDKLYNDLSTSVNKLISFVNLSIFLLILK